MLERARDNDQEANRLLAIEAAYLDRLEANGHAWHALHYLRAGLQAQRGETEAALRSLERAVAMGWRRGWWMRLDPALAPLHHEERFRRLLATIEEANGSARSRLEGAAP
jgi:hypothetical protein